jgi:TRAP-type C4-dicarboxylate transport system permease small subunit
MDRLLKINKIIGKVEYNLLAYAVLFMASLLIINSVGRTVFNYSVQAVDELCQISVLIITFIGLSNAARHGKHVVMTAIYDSLPQDKKRLMNIITSGLTSLFLFFLTYLCVFYAMKVFAYGRITTVLRIPMYLVVGIMPLGSLLAALQYTLMTFLNISNKDINYTGSEKIEVEDVLQQQNL